jgi:antitoxin component YwqK of YwqJK toxin-antitoxin module
MKKIQALSIFILTFSISFNALFAQGNLNQFDTNGKRHGVWKKYYKNKRLRYTGNFVNGKEVGTFKYYSAANSDFPIVVREYNKDNDIADVKFYAINGVLESKGRMQGKKRIGKWIYFHENSKVVMSEENYIDGKLDGPYKTFYKSGKPTEVANYKNGLLHGSYLKYAIKGHIYQDFNYQNGKLNGSAVYYNRKTGDLTTKGTFKDDVRVGTWENWGDGELISTEQPNKKKERIKKTKE